MLEPGYIALYRSGELERRAEALEVRLGSCDICPRVYTFIANPATSRRILSTVSRVLQGAHQ